MRFVMFYHSLRSDWNHGNAHFLRGVVSELLALGHQVTVYEPRDGWSLTQLLAGHGEQPVHDLATVYPSMDSRFHGADLDLDAALGDADAVLVHEWNDPALVRRIGAHRHWCGRYVLLFHDTHHRAVTAKAEMSAYDLRHYDGVLAFGAVIRELYLARGWARRAWTWHEAADTRVFRPLRDPQADPDADLDLLWIGNWGDDERGAELREYLIDPVARLGLRAAVHGVRYPEAALRDLEAAGIAYRGWIANYAAPAAFARARVTVHVPRRPYANALPGIPTIRVFEALACGIPLVSAPWDDSEGLFVPGEDFLVARDGEQMQRQLRMLLADPERARLLAASGLARIRARHTCAHRVRELLAIITQCGADGAPMRSLPASRAALVPDAQEHAP